MPTIIEVTVNTLGPTPTLSINPDPASVPAGVRGPIQWRITNPAQQGWKFLAGGIDFVDPGTEFNHPNGGGMRVFTWNNNHTKPGTYKYAVRVTNDETLVEIDPHVINN